MIVSYLAEQSSKPACQVKVLHKKEKGEKKQQKTKQKHTKQTPNPHNKQNNLSDMHYYYWRKIVVKMVEIILYEGWYKQRRNLRLFP